MTPKKPPAPKRPTKDEEKVRYLVTDAHGAFIVELEPHWKLTFAAVNPAQASSYREGFALRVYEGRSLRAVFCNVQNFRDLSIPLARKVSKETGSATWTKDSAGNFEESRSISVDHRLEPGDDFGDGDPFGAFVDEDGV